ncbi:MAG TPA: DUF433 domain-containing protein [Chloroflexota bacterium]|nr:DUF433 domain-containing protein [Chloroflexota bacterium]
MQVPDEQYRDRIVTNPEILGGKPVVKGTRIPVSLILNLLGNGYDFARIRDAYPDLDDEDIRAAVRYAEARINREQIKPFDQAV